MTMSKTREENYEAHRADVARRVIEEFNKRNMKQPTHLPPTYQQLADGLTFRDLLRIVGLKIKKWKTEISFVGLVAGVVGKIKGLF